MEERECPKVFASTFLLQIEWGLVEREAKNESFHVSYP
jgi:hypothetical protein